MPLSKYDSKLPIVNESKVKKITSILVLTHSYVTSNNMPVVVVLCSLETRGIINVCKMKRPNCSRIIITHVEINVRGIVYLLCSKRIHFISVHTTDTKTCCIC